MARTKYTFEKRQREKARRLKQIEKASKRMMAKKQKTGLDPGVPGEDAESGAQSPSDDGEATGNDEDAGRSA